MKPGVRPRVGISRCLLGDDVRYDGRHRYEPTVIEPLSEVVEWVPVCPEVEVGMGVPREAIHLVTTAGRIGLVGVESGADWTGPMEAWAGTRIDELRALDLSAFVLKARSPSCGLRDVPIRGGTPGRGLFADALLRAMPELVVEDEERLRDAAARDAFVRALRARHRG